MFAEIIQIESLPFNIYSDVLFDKVLDAIGKSCLWLKSIDHDKNCVIAIGNIKINKSELLLKKTSFGGKLGLYVFFPLSTCSNTLYFDQLSISVSEENDQKSIMHISGRFATVGLPVYSNNYTIDYYDLRMMLIDAAEHVKIKEYDTKSSIRVIHNVKKRPFPHWLRLLMYATFVIVIIYLVYDLFNK